MAKMSQRVHETVKFKNKTKKKKKGWGFHLGYILFVLWIQRRPMWASIQYVALMVSDCAVGMISENKPCNLKPNRLLDTCTHRTRRKSNSIGKKETQCLPVSFRNEGLNKWKIFFAVWDTRFHKVEVLFLSKNIYNLRFPLHHHNWF